MRLSAEIRAHRARNNINQRPAAVALGVSLRTLSDRENGRSPEVVTVGFCLAVASWLDVEAVDVCRWALADMTNTTDRADVPAGV